MSENAKEQQPQLDSNRPIFDLHRVYAKNSSLETPHSPDIFRAKWDPELNTAPNILFPYAREFISNLVARATFPQLNLAPINFEALFRARKAQQEAQAAAANKDEKAEEPKAE